MDADVAGEFASLKIRSFLLEKILFECYVRALTTGGVPRQEGGRQVLGMISRQMGEIERALVNSADWLADLSLTDRQSALQKVREQIQSLMEVFSES